jgi:DNA-binding CsgD family transcriptional regulator
VKSDEAQIVASLTSREYEVLQLVALGLSNKEFATTLTVSLPTVKSHVHNVLAKLGTRRRLDAGRLLHIAAADASVPPPALRELGIVTARRTTSLLAAADRPPAVGPVAVLVAAGCCLSL